MQPYILDAEGTGVQFDGVSTAEGSVLVHVGPRTRRVDSSMLRVDLDPLLALETGRGSTHRLQNHATAQVVRRAKPLEYIGLVVEVEGSTRVQSGTGRRGFGGEVPVVTGPDLVQDVTVLKGLHVLCRGLEDDLSLCNCADLSGKAWYDQKASNDEKDLKGVDSHGSVVPPFCRELT